MRSGFNSSVCAAQVEDLAGGILRQSLQLIDHGYRCTARALLLVLFFAASRTASLHDACRRLRQAPCDQAVRDALRGQLPTMAELERRLNRALQQKLPRSLKRRRRPMAIDLTETCYYGQPYRQQRELRRGKRRQGTTRFHGYATLCVLRRGERFTVALTYAWKDDSHRAIVQRLLEAARRIGLRPRYLLLDRGFYGLAVVEQLKGMRCPFLMPVAHRGRRSGKPLAQQSGTRRFLAWKQSGWSEHVMRYQGRQSLVKICVAQRPPDRRGKRGRPIVYAYWGLTPPSPAWVRQSYRTRYGIESSYRQMNQGRIRTCSRDPWLRLLLMGVALVLRNVWVYLHRRVLGRVRGRGIELHPERLRLRTMLLMLQHCAEAGLQCAEGAQLLLDPRPATDSGP